MKKKRSAGQIQKNTELAKMVIKHHFGIRPKKIVYKPSGLTNYVFDVKIPEGDFVVRISSSREKIHDYAKEQWAVARAAEHGIPVAEILETGNNVIPKPYMIQKKVEGEVPLIHEKRIDILKQLAKYTAKINSVPTTDYGRVFDWSENKLSKNATWKEYLFNELEAERRVKFLEKNKMLTRENVKKIEEQLEKIAAWNYKPSLNHGDIRLKNVVVNKNADISAILDWEDCSSNIAPYWDLSIALHDLTIDDKEVFLESYGVDKDEFMKHAFSLKVFNILNYVGEIETCLTPGEQHKLENFKLRLNGYLDLFSL